MNRTRQPTLREGVARDRRISVEDGEMRHGRKSASRRVDGYKRHVGLDLDTGLVRAVGVTHRDELSPPRFSVWQSCSEHAASATSS